jgi:agmatine/peptidylarginine deiminase
MTDLTNPTKDGFIMPGEFETHEGCWLAWPFKASNHRQNGFHVQKAFVNIAQGNFKFLANLTETIQFNTISSQRQTFFLNF